MEIVLIPIGLILSLILMCVYFLPTFFAWRRAHPRGIAILVLNLLLGWTLVGWFGALAWSFSDFS